MRPPARRAGPVLGALVCLSAAHPSGVAAQVGDVVDVSGGWSVAVAPAPADWSGTAVADERWPVTSLRTSWHEQGLEGVTGTVWYRRRVSLPRGAGGGPRRAALLLGPLTYGSWTLYADGAPVGGLGSDADPLPYPRARLVELPEGVLRDGEVVLSLRVHRTAWAADAAGRSLGAFGTALLGPPEVLSLRLQASLLAQKQAHLGELLFAAAAILFGLYHLYLYGARPAQRTYLWFGTAAVAFAVNALAVSPWTAASFAHFAPAYRLSSASGHLAAALLLLFLWETFDRRPGTLVGSYLLSHLVLGGLVLAAPFRWVVVTEPPRFLWLLPGLALALGLLGLELRRGHPDARILAAGVLAVAAAEVSEMLRAAGAALPAFLPYAGFTVALLAVAGTLASRFSREHRELEELRRDLEARVNERTEALARATREAEVANEAKSRFLTNMSHELRTPLNAVIGFANLIHKRAVRTKGVLQHQEMDFLERIRANGAHLLALVDRLLDLSRIESGAVELDYAEVDLGTLVSRLLAELSPQAVQRDILLHAVVPTRLAPVHTDPVRMKQILVNLVDNAVKFTERGSVTVTVHAFEGRVRRVDVADTGVGIPADRLEAMLDAFTQVDESAARRHLGVGLGLTITRSLCDLLGYRLTLESTPGSGTVARVDLDPGADDRPGGPAARPAERAAAPGGRLSFLRGRPGARPSGDPPAGEATHD